MVTRRQDYYIVFSSTAKHNANMYFNGIFCRQCSLFSCSRFAVVSVISRWFCILLMCASPVGILPYVICVSCLCIYLVLRPFVFIKWDMRCSCLYTLAASTDCKHNTNRIYFRQHFDSCTVFSDWTFIKLFKLICFLNFYIYSVTQFYFKPNSTVYRKVLYFQSVFFWSCLCLS